MNPNENHRVQPPGIRDVLFVMGVPVLAILGAGGATILLYTGLRTPVMLALLVTIVGALAGSLVLILMWRYMPSYLPQAIMAAMGIRMLITLIGIVIFVLTLSNLGLQFLLCAIGFYFVGLVCETIIAVKKLTV